MRNSQKMKYIIGTCMLAVAVISLIIIIRTLRPSPGRKYEQLGMDQALEYMMYEEDYILVDVSSREEFEDDHMPDAVSIPYQNIQDAYSVLTDPDQQIYIYSRSEEISQKAAAKLCEMGYINITEIGVFDDWLRLEETDAVFSSDSVL